MFPENVTLKVLNNENNGTKVLRSVQVKVEGDATYYVDAQVNATYQLIDDATGLGPENIMTKRVGNDLWIAFEGEVIDDPSLIIKSFYESNADYATGTLIGLAEDGAYYPYVPESNMECDAIHYLADQVTAGQALGNSEIVPVIFPWWGAFVAGVVGLGILGFGSRTDDREDTVESLPRVNPDEGSGPLGVAVSVDVAKNDDINILPNTIRIVGADGNGVLVVPNEGVWTVGPHAGQITFTPNSDFLGDPTPIKYTGENSKGELSNPAEVTIKYTSFIEVTD